MIGTSSAHRFRRAGYVIPLCAALVLDSCFLLPKEDDILAPPLARPPEITYATTRVARATLENTITAYGSFIFSREVDLSFEKRGGRLDRIFVASGEAVARGALVAALHTDEAENSLAQARLAARRAELALQRAQAQLQDTYALQLARADLKLAQLRLENARAGLDRERKLRTATGLESSAIRDLELAVAEQEIAATKAGLAVKRLESSTSSIDVQLAAIDVEAAKLRVQQLEGELEAARLYAPIAGRVTWVSQTARKGEYLEAYQRFIRIADPSALLFEYIGNQSDRFRAGMQCTVTVGERTYRGEVVLSPASAPFDLREQYPQTVHVAVSGLPAEVRPGTTGVALLVLARRENVLVLPNRAVQMYGTRRYVHVLVNGVRVERDVEVGLETATDVEIVAGLAEGEEVVVR